MPTVLPCWVQYVQALGTPIVAVVAGAITSYIAWRQWKTARDKVRLNLFDRRLAIYEAAWQLVAIFKVDHEARDSEIPGLISKLRTAEWLLGHDNAERLSDFAFQVKRYRDLKSRAMHGAGTGAGSDATWNVIEDLAQKIEKFEAQIIPMFKEFLAFEHLRG